MPTTIETLRRALEVFRVPSSGPQPKDIYKAQHWEMAGAHAFLVNALLSVYEVCACFFPGFLLEYNSICDGDSKHHPYPRRKQLIL